MDREKENGQGWRVSLYEPNFKRWQNPLGFLSKANLVPGSSHYLEKVTFLR